MQGQEIVLLVIAALVLGFLAGGTAGVAVGRNPANWLDGDKHRDPREVWNV